MSLRWRRIPNGPWVVVADGGITWEIKPLTDSGGWWLDYKGAGLPDDLPYGFYVIADDAKEDVAKYYQRLSTTTEEKT